MLESNRSYIFIQTQAKIDEFSVSIYFKKSTKHKCKCKYMPIRYVDVRVLFFSICFSSVRFINTTRMWVADE